MTCPWPECDGNHARCAVLLACLEQVAALPRLANGDRDWPATWRWAVEHNYIPSMDKGFKATTEIATMVADRLLAWLRWQGTAADGYQRFQGRRARGVCAVCDREYALNSQGRVYSHATPDGRPGQVTDMCPGRRQPPSNTNHEERAARHPLDGTDVAGLRPAGMASFTELTDGELAETGWMPDWPAVAVVADYLSTCGGWLWVHDFREVVPSRGEPSSGAVGVRPSRVKAGRAAEASRASSTRPAVDRW